MKPPLQIKATFLILFLCSLNSPIFSQNLCEQYCAVSNTYVNLCSDCDEPIAADNCADAATPLICHLDGFEFTNCGATPDGPPSAAGFCGGGTGIHNNMWIGFVPAESGRLHINIEVGNCLSTDPECYGLQVALARALCRNPNNEFYGFEYETLACVNCTNQNLDLITMDAIAGEPHYIMVDGCCGDVCDMVVHVMDGLPEGTFSLEASTSAFCPDLLNPNCFSPQSAVSVTAVLDDPGMTAGGLLFDWYDQDGNLLYSGQGFDMGDGNFSSTLTGLNPGTGQNFFCGLQSLRVDCSDGVTCCRQSITIPIEPTDPPEARAEFMDPDVSALNCEHDQLVLKGATFQGIDVLFENWYKIDFIQDPPQKQTIPTEIYNSNSSELRVFLNDPTQPGVEDENTGPGVYMYSYLPRNANCLSEVLICVPANNLAPHVEIKNPQSIDCGSNSTVILDASDSEVLSTVMNCEVDIARNIFPTEEDVPTNNYEVEWTSLEGHAIVDANSLMASVQSPGTYTCTITNLDNFCSTSQEVVVTSSGAIPLLDLEPVVDMGCGNSITLSPTIIANADDASFSWSDGNQVIGTDQDIDLSSPGIYTLTVIDNQSNCENTISVEVIASDGDPPIIEPMTSTDITCIASTSFIDPIITGNSTYEFQWLKDGEMFETTEDITVSEEGVYTLIVTDSANGCSSEQSTRVYLHQEIPQLLPIDDNLLTCANNGQSDIYVNFGVTDDPYIGLMRYEWTDAAGNVVSDNAFLRATEGGIYNVLVTNTFNGCTAEETVNVGVDADLPIIDPINPDAITCSEQTVTVTGSGSAGTATTEFNWYQNGMLISSGNDLEVIEPGQYELVLTNLDNGCSVSTVVDVEENFENPIIDANPPSEITCLEQSIDIDASTSSGQGNLNFTWEGPNGQSFDALLNTDVAGTYVLTVEDQMNGCITSQTFVVSENLSPPQDLFAEAGEITCDDQTTSIVAHTLSNDVTYEWSSPDNQNFNGQIINIDVPGIYTLISTNNLNGCTAATTVEVKENLSAPQGLSATEGMLDCQNEEVQLDASANSNNVSFEWISPGNVSSFGESLQASSAGVYTIIATNNATGCTSSTTTEVEANDEIPSLSTNFIDGTGPIIDCNNSSSLIEGLTDPGIDLQWIGPNNESINGNMITVSEAGEYTLLATDPISLCAAEIVINIEQNFEEPQIAASVLNTISCAEAEALILVQNANANNTSYEWSYAGNLLPENGEEISVDQAGVYTVIATGENGCTSTDEIEVIGDFETPVPTAADDHTLTCLENTYNLEGGSDLTDVSFEWNGPDGFTSNEADPSITAPGNYILIVTALSNQCSAEIQVTIDEDFDPPSLEPIADALIDCNNPMATFEAITDASSASYEWMTPDQEVLNSQSINTEIPGVYTLMVTNNDNACTVQESFIIDADFDLPLAEAEGGELDCQNAALNLQANIDGDVTYSWTGPNGYTSTELNPEVTEVGEYVLTAMGTNGCVSESVAIVSADENIPEAAIESDDGQVLNCITQTLNLSGSTNLNDMEFNWTLPDGSTTMNESNISINAAGTYTLEVTNPMNGCSKLSVVEIEEDFEEPSLITEGATITCIEEIVNISASSDEDISLVSWLGPNYNSEDLTASGIDEAGLYTVTITALDNGCTSVASVEVLLDQEEPLAAANGEMITCIKEEVALNSDGSSEGSEFTYLWFLNGNIVWDDRDFEVTSPGEYTLQVTDTSNGCIAEASTTIEENTNVPLADAGADAFLTCNENNETLNGSASVGQGDLEYAWMNASGAVIGNEAELMTAETGTFVLTVTDLLNGCSASDEVVIQQDMDAPMIFLTPFDQIDCQNSSTELNALDSPAQGELLFQWTDENGVLVSTEGTFEVEEGGLYQLMVTDQSNNCSSHATVEVIENKTEPSFEITSSGEINCIIEEVSLETDLTNVGDPSISWTGPNGFSSNDEYLENISVPGIYELLVRDEVNGCSAEKEIEVLENIVEPITQLSVDGEINCSTNELTLNSSLSGPDYEFNWSGPSIISGAADAYPVVNEGGEYNLIITDLNSGCNSMASILVVQNDTEIEEVIYSLSDVNCDASNSGSIIIDDLVSGTAPFQYSIDGGETFTTETEFEELPAGAYEIVVQDAIGCQIYEEAILEDFEALELEYTSSAPDNSIIAGDAVQLIPLSNFEIMEVTWNDPEISAASPWVSPTITTTYEVIAYDADGCSVEYEITIEVIANRPVFIPTGFSPNGDGINDRLVIFANLNLVEEVQQFNIYDRWGVEIFNRTDFIPNDETFGWDGTFKNEVLEPGVYFYYAVILFNDGSSSVIKGEFTIVR